jgi:Telomere resolvase
VESVVLDVRAEVIQVFRDRIRHGSHVRLTTDDFAVLIEGFVEGLRGAKSKKPIQALCEAEIKLLEEGYPQASVAKYLSRYRTAIRAAVEDGSLQMTKATSHRYVHTQRVTGIKEERLEHWALTYLKYSNEVYESLDKRQQTVKLNRLSTEDVSEVDEMPDRVDAVPVGVELPMEVSTMPDAVDGEIATELQRLQDTCRTELDRRVQQLRDEFEAQLKADKGNSMGWFIRRIETLEEENLKLRLEQDKAIAAGGSLGHDDAGEVDRLKAENQAIALELKTVQQKLNAFRQLLDGDAEVSEGKADDGAIASAPKVEQVSTVRPQPQDAGDKVQPVGTTRGISTGVSRGPKAGKAFERAENIFLAVKDWNRLHPDQAFAINAGVLETVFRVHRQAVKSFFEAYQDEIEVYHQELGVESPRWFNRGKDTQRLREFVEEWGKGN